MSMIGNSSRQLCARAMISASIVKRAVSVCNFETQRTGQSNLQKSDSVCIFALGLSKYVGDHPVVGHVRPFLHCPLLPWKWPFWLHGSFRVSWFRKSIARIA
ncbi:hypothetical protein THAOC_37026 [Thalassiosira oceanica]|uniref:Uncharacterized protein n=1 Tax=Thalassiosira oceanica TaxID=159749 RepID=K0QYT8_THAOC|nr:hypothetical protein THAOC_37026 [Thalassiosira oceanica]|eukprot:EJK44433.1 hypothetical protein THAOC_37026 [Thalassiosira oceanica]